MRITIDIDSSTLEEVIKLTGEKKKSPAVTKAATESVPVGHRAPDHWEGRFSSVRDFVRRKYGERHEEWFAALKES